MSEQLPLFRAEAEAHRDLREAHAHLAAAYGDLQHRYEALWREARALTQELALARASARTLLAEAWRQPSTPAPTLEPLLKRLLLLAHPDKWSQNQPASALAHELSVAINQLREVQP